MEHPPPSRLICPMIRHLYPLTTALTPYIGATTKNQEMSLLGVVLVNVRNPVQHITIVMNVTYLTTKNASSLPF
ncbi:hypothetical protein Bca52824_001097 [Brassica carinata]|uniref:Uncharacterized protein n=1 Tax=Brassica carinata TaxID=52824 RepID=A0A8X8BCR9_BRACI|nr:hypothetical protein Bca52824_001097 [Brassica carinata]